MEDYDHDWYDLGPAARLSAYKFKQTLLSFPQWQESHVQFLLSPTKQQIKDKITWMGQQSASGALCVFYFAGHGGTFPADLYDPDENDHYDEAIYPREWDGGSPETAILDDELKDWLKKWYFFGKKRFVFLDACRSGGFIEDGNDLQTIENDIVVVTACRRDEDVSFSGWDEEPFSKNFRLALKSMGSYDSNQNRAISAEEAYDYASSKNYEYTPVLYDGDADVDMDIIVDPHTPFNLQVSYDKLIQLNWNENTEWDLAGYNVYKKIDGTWTKVNETLLADNSYSEYPDGFSTFYYKVSAVDNDNNESYPTQEKSCTVTYLYNDCGNSELEPHLVQGFDETGWGSAPGYTMSVDAGGKVIYHYDELDPNRKYRIKVTYYDPYYWEPDGKSIDPNAEIENKYQNLIAVGSNDEYVVHGPLMLVSPPETYSFDLPSQSYINGEVYLHFNYVSGRQGSAQVSEIWIEDNGPLGKRAIPEMAQKHKKGEKIEPITYRLYQNYPNPFNSTTSIYYDLPEPAQIRLCIYNLRGQMVRRLSSGFFEEGQHVVVWDGKDEQAKDVPSGVYIYILKTPNYVRSKKLLLIR